MLCILYVCMYFDKIDVKYMIVIMFGVTLSVMICICLITFVLYFFIVMYDY